MDELADIQALVPDKPTMAFAQLWSRLESDHPFMQQSVNRCNQNLEHYDGLIEDMVRQLREHEALSAPLTSDLALALLSALDRWLAESFSSFNAPSTLVDLPDDTQVWIHRRPLGWRSTYSRQPNHLQYWLRHHWLTRSRHQGIDIRIRPAPENLYHRMTRVLARNGSESHLRIAVAAFVDAVQPEWSHEPPYHCDQLDDPETRWCSIEEALAFACTERSHVLVLPELTACPMLRERVVQWLRGREHSLFLIVPGSFHEQHGKERWNRAVVFDGLGTPVLEHRKLQAMIVRDEHDRREAIQGASRLELLSTPLGLLGVAICLDYCDDAGHLGTLWQTVGPGLVLVPSMSDHRTRRAHERKAKTLHRGHAAIAAVAIQPPEPSRPPATLEGYGLLFPGEPRWSAHGPGNICVLGVLEYSAS